MVRRGRALVLSGALAVGLASTAPGAQLKPNVEELLTRVGQRIANYYQRAQNVICIEKSVVQPIGLNYSPEGFSRTVESELRVETDSDDPDSEPNVIRRVRKVNGRAPRESDKKERSGCTDPDPLSTEPLAFLLPSHRAEYTFTSAGSGSDRNRSVQLIDFGSANRKSNAELIEDKGGHDDCFDWSGQLAMQGRIWVDAASYDVVRVERHLRGPVDLRVPAALQRKHHLLGWMVIVREDVTTRYRTVAFEDPTEVLLLPESIDTVMLLRGGLQSTRRSQTFSEYRRFVTEGRIVK